VLPFGQAISRTTYATLFTLVSTTFGVGDGSTTFNVPDLRGRVAAGKDDMGGSAANRVTNAGSGIVGTTLGATGGGETVTLTAANHAAHNHGITDPGHSHSVQTFGAAAGANSVAIPDPGSVGGSVTGTHTTGITTANQGSATPVNNMQPAIVLNYILRII
jgi:microcystin-dependent protein